MFHTHFLISGDVQISVTYGQESSHQCLQDNDDITLICTVNPLTTMIIWYKETTNIGRCNTYGFCVHDGDIDTIKYTFSFTSPGEFTLRINPVSPANDAGVYTCEHGGASDSASVSLDACGKFTLYFTRMSLFQVKFRSE